MNKVKLGEVFKISSGGTPSKAHPEYYGGSIPWVKTGDLKTKYLYEVESYITEAGLNNSSAKIYDPETVLIAMYGATIGATSILKIKACTNQACAAFKANDIEVFQSLSIYKDEIISSVKNNMCTEVVDKYIWRCVDFNRKLKNIEDILNLYEIKYQMDDVIRLKELKIDIYSILENGEGAQNDQH